MKNLQRVLAVTALIGVLSGCSTSIRIGDAGDTGPTCLPPWHGRPKELNGTLVLAAQSVQTASLVPCLRPLPAGWAFQSFDAHRGQSRIQLALGANDDRALVVTLTRQCDIGSAARTASDRTGARRYDETRASRTTYSGERYYVFPGGCLTFHFDVRGVGATDAASTVVRSVDLVDRMALRRYVRAYSRGRFNLDPVAGS